MAGFNDTFLRACRGERVSHTPVWFMRQAGRYLPEYRALREKHGLLEIAKTPELALEVTLQPLRRFGFDAAILFADILLILEPMGCAFSFQKGEGPVIEKPIRSADDIARLRVFEPREDLAFVMKAVALLFAELKVPLIGFAGAPFTVASYMIEGGHSRHFQNVKRVMYEEPRAWHQLMEKIATVTQSYLSAQIESGAQAIQLFDSWVGALSVDDYRQYVLPHSARILQGLRDKFGNKIPRIHFGTGTSMLLPSLLEAGATVIGVDWQTPLSFARKTLGERVALQGNLDPLALFAPKPILLEKIHAVLRDIGGTIGQGGHVFNLGHGILPETPLEAVQLIVDTVHEATRA